MGCNPIYKWHYSFQWEQACTSLQSCRSVSCLVTQPIAYIYIPKLGPGNMLDTGDLAIDWIL